MTVVYCIATCTPRCCLLSTTICLCCNYHHQNKVIILYSSTLQIRSLFRTMVNSLPSMGSSLVYCMLCKSNPKGVSFSLEYLEQALVKCQPVYRNTTKICHLTASYRCWWLTLKTATPPCWDVMSIYIYSFRQYIYCEYLK